MGTVLLIICAWFLVGALPRMRADAADRLPAIRKTSRANMSAHSGAARGAGRRKGAEWYGWTAVATAAETTAILGYMFTSAWHGWGDHINRARRLRANRASNRASRATPDGTVPDPTVPPTVPDGTPPTVPPDGPGGGNRATPPDAAVPQPAAPAAVPAGPALVPGPAPQNGVVTPFRRPSGAASRGGNDMTMTAEAASLEMAVQVAERLIGDCLREHDDATAELQAANAAAAQMENYGAQLAGAGVRGGVMDALGEFSDATQARIAAAQTRIAGADSSLAAARKAREELRRHEAAADALQATGGAAKETAWYGAQQGGGSSSLLDAAGAQ